jgi:hypothetical protein
MWLALAGPGLVLGVLLAGTGLASLATGSSPVLAPVNGSLAEAAGNRDAAEVVSWLTAGARIDEPATMRLPLKLRGTAVLTPMEAAVLSEWTPMMRLLVEAGAVRDAPTLTRLRCIAARERDRQTIDYLSELDGGRPLGCERVALPAYVPGYTP